MLSQKNMTLKYEVKLLEWGSTIKKVARLGHFSQNFTETAGGKMLNNKDTTTDTFLVS